MAEATCIASGPSLTKEDAETVRQWQGPGHIVIAVNTSYQIAPWADVLFAMDGRWWKQYAEAVKRDFNGRCISVGAWQPWIESAKSFHDFKAYGNSGAGAIAVARHLGAKRIVLLGYDCKREGAKVHWHGDHPKGLGNGGSIVNWFAQFGLLAQESKGVEIVNASRDTALRCFRRASLSEALQPLAVTA